MSWKCIRNVSSFIDITSFNTTTSSSSGQALLGDTSTNGEWNQGEWWIIDELLQTNSSLAPLSFSREGYKYTISFTLIPGPSTGGPTGDEQTLVCVTGSCAGVTIPEGEIWVFTPEYKPGTSSLYVAMRYDASLIPEPSALALFGLGATGLSYPHVVAD